MRLNEREVLRVVRRLQRRELRAWMRAGWVRPVQTDHEPVFDDVDVARLRLICDLRKEMALPNDAVPMVLSLLDQVHGLRRELRTLARAIERQPHETRRAILQELGSGVDASNGAHS
jgi:chaperone modulatory protein CbpM